jgi:putative ABC transport system substrate-binding protein
MQRRQFISLIGGVVGLPLLANAQSNRTRKIGILMPFPKDSSEGQARVVVLLQELRQLGWTVGNNLNVEYRWDSGDADFSRKAAAELVALSPDVILGTATPAVTALQQASSTVPVVFAMVADPVSLGFVASQSRPGGNLTGFTILDYAIGAKWLELLKEFAPHVTRVGIVRDPTVTSNIGQYAAIQSVAGSFGVELVPLGGRDAKDVEQTISEFAHRPNCGLISVASPLTANHSRLIISLAARHRMPAIYPLRFFVAAGGLMAYGADPNDIYRRAAGYIDRILKGEKPTDLPVQAPTKFALTINLKTAKSLGLAVPPMMLARANEVIE